MPAEKDLRIPAPPKKVIAAMLKNTGEKPKPKRVS